MLISSSGLFIAVAALAFDALIGDPDWLWRRLGHPVALIGALIGYLDRRLNREHHSQQQRKSAGIGAVRDHRRRRRAGRLSGSMTLQQLPVGNVALALVASIFIAQRSLYEHVARVR